jgi:hypothetical protein
VAVPTLAGTNQLSAYPDTAEVFLFGGPPRTGVPWIQPIAPRTARRGIAAQPGVSPPDAEPEQREQAGSRCLIRPNTSSATTRHAQHAGRQALRGVVAVGEGRGFVVQGKERYVVTAAHCAVAAARAHVSF